MINLTQYLEPGTYEIVAETPCLHYFPHEGKCIVVALEFIANIAMKYVGFCLDPCFLIFKYIQGSLYFFTSGLYGCLLVSFFPQMRIYCRCF